MTPQEHARDLFLRLSAIKPEHPDDIANLLVRSFEIAIMAERERCAGVPEQVAKALICGRRRTNQVDRHTADVLMRMATKIREAKP
jgi:hypothetical protein